LLLGAALAGVAVRRRNWPAVLLIAIAVRMLLDPETYDYYNKPGWALAVQTAGPADGILQA
jgi:hypothetical protein